MNLKKNLLAIVGAAIVMFFCGQSLAQTQNFLSAQGNKLFDSNGNEVRLTGVNWFGFETALLQPHGLWTRDMKSVLQQIKDLGFNTIRVPWTNGMLAPGATISINSFGTDGYTGISPMNAEESQVSTPLELMDIFVNWCQENDIRIILDNHSREPDGYLSEALWYTNSVSEEQWIADWVFLAERYKNFAAVTGFDLNNEPHDQATWGNSSPATDWNKAAERCGNAILAVNPNALIIVEGIEEFAGETTWWGGNLRGAGDFPIVLSDPGKLVYSPHEYGPEVFEQLWFSDPTFPNNMEAIWNKNFAFIHNQNTAPLFVGEFGIKNFDASGGIQGTWFETFVAFMGSKYSWTFWTMNPNSGDTGGILTDDWVGINQNKLDVLAPHLHPRIPVEIGGIGNNPPVANFTTNLTTGDAPLDVAFDASLSSDPDGDTLSYNWNFGDGSTGTGVIVSYIYDTPGSYIASLTVTDGKGGSAQKTQTISVTSTEVNTPPVASFTASALSGVAPFTLSFDGSASSDADGDALSYSWDFADGNVGSGAIVSNTFVTSGTYSVLLTVSDGKGGLDTTSASIIVEPNNGGGDCDNLLSTFGVPLNTGLPSLGYQRYANIFVLGTGGPDLSNVTEFSVNWENAPTHNGLYQFSIQTNDGQPSWWQDLRSSVTFDFVSANPGITLTGTNFAGLDGSYFVNKDGDNFVLVETTGAYAIYLSQTATPPACLAAGSIAASIFPNPSENEFHMLFKNVGDIERIDIFNNTGTKELSIEPQDIKNNELVFGQKLQPGTYIIQVMTSSGVKSMQLIKNN